MTVDFRDIEALEARMPGVFAGRLASQPQPVLLAERLRWRATVAACGGNPKLATEYDRDADAVAQLQQSLADTRQQLTERDETIKRLNATIRLLGGGQ